MNKQKLIYYCLDCGIPIHFHTALYGKGRCMKCKSKGKNNGRWHGGLERRLVFCIICNKQLNLTAFYEGSKYCKSCAQKDDRGNNYIDGRSLEKYGTEFSKELKDRIRNRDNYECQVCKITEKEHLINSKKTLVIHHIDGNKYNNNTSNLVSLCVSCHIIMHWEIKQYATEQHR